MRAEDTPSMPSTGALARSRSRYHKGGDSVKSKVNPRSLPRFQRPTDADIVAAESTLDSNRRSASGNVMLEKSRPDRPKSVGSEEIDATWTPESGLPPPVSVGALVHMHKRASIASPSLARKTRNNSGDRILHTPHQPLSEQSDEGKPSLKPLPAPKRNESEARNKQNGVLELPLGKEKRQRNFSVPSIPDVTRPAFDAPISAVNAGERRATVKYNGMVRSLAVTPSTTPSDIIDAASALMPEPIDKLSTILMESYKKLGLERPLRNYEHVRDVMNSWDNDTSNCLIIVPSPTGGSDDDLALKQVSMAQPGDTVVNIHHSQRPGTWEKRLITLRSDGQVLLAKKDGRETSNICHLSDFDIYVPSARQLSRKIRPPRKYCFAVKSQQKSSMFMSTVNFVHFFSTSDKALASSWYKAVQEWRSWYLVNVMGAGQIPLNKTLQSKTAEQHRDCSRGMDDSAILKRQSSSEQGSGVALSRMPVRSRGPPPVSFPKGFTKDHPLTSSACDPGPASIQKSSAELAEPGPFSSTSLLGRSYTTRHNVQNHAKAIPGIIQRNPSIPQPNGNVNSGRIAFAHSKPEPLVDLTPQYRELPQHRKGRGVMPEQIPAGGLVEVATTPDQAIQIPPAVAWQKPRTRSNDKCQNARQTSASPQKSISPLEHGLIANRDQSQGNLGTGRGVRTGDRFAKQPMLDMMGGSKYVPGSLLDRVERSGRGDGLLIDREKRREIKVGVGEGL